MIRKKTFTLFEIIISIILVSIIYSFAINSFSTKKKIKSDDVTIFNLKEKLLKYGKENEMGDNITIKCIRDDFSCYLFIDDDKIPLEDKIKPFFLDTPTIYKYNKELEKIDFLDLELEQLERYEVIFKYSCKKNKKCSEFIVETENMIYIFNDIKKKPDTIKYISDIDDYFELKVEEVKDAF